MNLFIEQTFMIEIRFSLNFILNKISGFITFTNNNNYNIPHCTTVNEQYIKEIDKLFNFDDPNFN